MSFLGKSGQSSVYAPSDILYRVRHLALITFFAYAAVCWPQGAVGNGTFEGYPAVTLSNGTLQLTITLKGSTLTSIVLADDQERLSPLWNPIRMARELGQSHKFDGGAGHFVCVDGFGAASPEENAAGMPFHGEAHAQTYEVHSGREGTSTTATLTAKLPIVQEVFTRTFRAVDGENVVSVETQLESLLGFDRPVNWAEHATIGSPFLESGVTVVDLSGSRSQTRPYEQVNNGPVQRRLQGGKDFTWPMAPGLNGKPIDLRQTPDNPHYLDHATTLLDPTRDLQWVTALNPKKRLILGYVFRRSEYPWLQYWGNYPPTGKMARGLEFSTQPYDVPRREVISAGTMFNTPMFRWLPAKSMVRSKFLLFYAHIPEGFGKVDDVRLENRQIVIEDRSAHKQVTLAATLGL
ncbi:MAG: hypothetical protein JOZ45_22290 [Acidobacteriaceae bacterium]|nr:hypothetical protein [Acidobacteriaceae bacterium]MBV9938896.1 hypothetical protein [Acidobacteriaceae bacterium]